MRMIFLTDLKPGQRAIVDSLPSVGAGMHRLLELGVLPGTRIEAVRRAPFGGPLEIRVRNATYSLRRDEASQIAVRPA